VKQTVEKEDEFEQNRTEQKRAEDRKNTQVGDKGWHS
jgi:hypothetical protein